MNMIPLSALDRPIAYHRIFRKVSGSTVAAVFLSQAWYWSQRIPEDRDGWFYKKQAEWEDETGLSRSEQETARKKLVQLDILEEKREGLPAVLWYRINTDQLSRLIRDELGNAETPQSSFSDTRNPDAVIPATIHTENTTENTVGERPARRRNTQIDQDFTPTPQDIAKLESEGFLREQVMAEVPKFIDYYTGHGKPRKNWNATFRNWVRNAKTYGTLAKATPVRRLVV